MFFLETDEINKYTNAVYNDSDLKPETIDQEIINLSRIKEELKNKPLDEELQSVVSDYSLLKMGSRGISGHFKMKKAEKRLDMVRNNYNKAMNLLREIDRIIDELKDLRIFWKKNKYYVYNEELDQPEESGMNC